MKEQSQAQIAGGLCRSAVGAAHRAAPRPRSVSCARSRPHAPGEINSLRLLGVALLDQDKTASAAVQTLRAKGLLAQPRFSRCARRSCSGLSSPQASPAPRAREEVRRVLEANPHHHRRLARLRRCAGGARPVSGRSVAFERARLIDPLRPDRAGGRRARGGGARTCGALLSRDPENGCDSRGGALRACRGSLTVCRGAEAERLLRHALSSPPTFRSRGAALPDPGRPRRLERPRRRSDISADRARERPKLGAPRLSSARA